MYHTGIPLEPSIRPLVVSIESSKPLGDRLIKNISESFSGALRKELPHDLLSDWRVAGVQAESQLRGESTRCILWTEHGND